MDYKGYLKNREKSENPNEVSKKEFTLLLGGIAYTLGLIFYFGGSKFKWWHSVWHLFDLLGTIFQFISLLLIVM